MSIVIHVVFAVIVGIVFVHTKILGAFGPVNIKQNYSNLQGEWTSDRATTITFDGDAFSTTNLDNWIPAGDGTWSMSREESTGDWLVRLKFSSPPGETVRLRWTSLVADRDGYKADFTYLDGFGMLPTDQVSRQFIRS